MLLLRCTHSAVGRTCCQEEWRSRPSARCQHTKTMWVRERDHHISLLKTPPLIWIGSTHKWTSDPGGYSTAGRDAPEMRDCILSTLMTGPDYVTWIECRCGLVRRCQSNFPLPLNVFGSSRKSGNSLNVRIGCELLPVASPAAELLQSC